MERVVRQCERAVTDSFGVLRDGPDLHARSCRIRHVCRFGRADDRGGREAENRLVEFAVRKVIVALKSLFAVSTCGTTVTENNRHSHAASPGLQGPG